MEATGKGVGPLVARRWAWILFALALLAIPLLPMLKPAPPLPDYGPMPDFALTDQRGQAVTDEALRGAPVIVDFIFTSCPDVCPALTTAMAGVGQRLADTEPPVRLVSVTVDPERDTPEVLASYAARYQAGPDWHFLTGPPETVKATLKGFMQVAEKAPMEGGQPGQYNVLHSQSFLLYDRQGTLRGIYGSDQAGVDRLVMDARRLAEDG